MGGVVSALTAIVSSIVGGLEAGFEAAGLIAVDVLEYEGAGLGAGLGADLGEGGDLGGSILARALVTTGDFADTAGFQSAVYEAAAYADTTEIYGAGAELAGIGTQTIVTPLGFFVFGTAGTLATAGLGAGIVLAATGNTSGNSAATEQSLQSIEQVPLVDLANKPSKDGRRKWITKCNGVRMENRRSRNKRMLSSSPRMPNKRNRRNYVCSKSRSTSRRKVRGSKK